MNEFLGITTPDLPDILSYRYRNPADVRLCAEDHFAQDRELLAKLKDTAQRVVEKLTER